MVQEAVYGTLSAVMKNLHNKTFLRGLSSAIDAASDPDRYMDSYLKNWARGVSPASGLGRSVQKWVDPTIYRVDSPWDSFAASFPTMAANGYLPDLDWLGRPKLMQPESGAVRALTPMPYSVGSTDPVDVFTNKLGVAKTKPLAKVSLRGKSYDLTPRMHNEYVREAGQISYRKLAGIARNMLPRLGDMTKKAQENFKQRLEAMITRDRQATLSRLIIKWKREKLIK